MGAEEKSLGAEKTGKKGLWLFLPRDHNKQAIAAISGNNQWFAAHQKPGWAAKISTKVSLGVPLPENLLFQNTNL